MIITLQLKHTNNVKANKKSLLGESLLKIKNKFQTVKKSNVKCPICNGDLYTVDNFMMQVMDGNTVYYCENVEEHKFWNHPFENNDILHLNKNASETDWTSEQNYKLVDGYWNVICIKNI